MPILWSKVNRLFPQKRGRLSLEKWAENKLDLKTAAITVQSPSINRMFAHECWAKHQNLSLILICDPFSYLYFPAFFVCFSLVHKHSAEEIIFVKLNMSDLIFTDRKTSRCWCKDVPYHSGDVDGVYRVSDMLVTTSRGICYWLLWQMAGRRLCHYDRDCLAQFWTQHVTLCLAQQQL